MNLQNINPLILHVDHLPLIRAVLDQLQIHEVLSEQCPQHELARISDADCAVAIILRALSGRVALYKIESWLEGLDMKVLFQSQPDPAFFNDTRLATALDHIDAVGTDNILAEIATRYLHRQPQEQYSIHQDTTSVLLQGLYETTDKPTPAHGFSKDHRPDLKQLIFGLTVNQQGIPLIASVKDGNTSDQEANRDHIKELQQLLPEDDEVTLVADCKLVDANTIGKVLGAGLHFVSLLPNSFSLRAELIEDAWKSRPALSQWPVLAEKPGRRKADPHIKYRGFSFARTFPVLLDTGKQGFTPVKSNEPLRFLVLYSDALAAKFERSLPGKLQKEVKKLQVAEKKLNKDGFACEADARTAASSAAAKISLHNVDVQVAVEERKVKRSRRGRPRAGEVTPTKSVWTVSLRPTPCSVRIDFARRQKSCFVLLTDWPVSLWSDQRVLSEYRHQSVIEGSCGFRWLKGPAQVSPIFLHKPHRIRALGLLLVLALMVRNTLQFRLRQTLAERGETLPHPFTKQPEARLTAEMALEHFRGLQSVRLYRDDQACYFIPPRLSETACRIVDLLGFSVDIFSSPPRWRGSTWDEKIRPRPSPTPEI